MSPHFRSSPRFLPSDSWSLWYVVWDSWVWVWRLWRNCRIWWVLWAFSWIGFYSLRCTVRNKFVYNTICRFESCRVVPKHLFIPLPAPESQNWFKIWSKSPVFPQQKKAILSRSAQCKINFYLLFLLPAEWVPECSLCLLTLFCWETGCW